MKGPQFLKYVKPILEVLQANGGVGESSSVIDDVVENLKINEEDLAKTTANGQSRIRNQIQWARFYLFKAGLIDNSQRGIWRLTKNGLEADLSDQGVYSMFKSVQKNFENNKKKLEDTNNNKNDFDETTTEDEEHSGELIKLIKKMSPAAFERLCKRLLIEIGIHDIEITGGSCDQGVDGLGLVKLNDVVSLNIVFQCKRYRNIISPHHVRDFRGAMQGRGEKGLIISTGRFTKEAKKEANRDGVTPIELIDGDRLVDLFEKYKIGLIPVTIYEIDKGFFDKFEKKI